MRALGEIADARALQALTAALKDEDRASGVQRSWQLRRSATATVDTAGADSMRIHAPTRIQTKSKSEPESEPAD